MAIQLVYGRNRCQLFAPELPLQTRRIDREIERPARQLNRFYESVGIEKNIHVADLADAHTSIVSAGPDLLWTLCLFLDRNPVILRAFAQKQDRGSVSHHAETQCKTRTGRDRLPADSGRRR